MPALSVYGEDDNAGKQLIDSATIVSGRNVSKEAVDAQNSSVCGDSDRVKKHVPYGAGEIIIAHCRLPKKVLETQNKKLMVFVRFFPKGKTAKESIFTAGGSGFICETDGIVCTARHILMDAVATIEKSGIKPTDYDYDFVGSIITEKHITQFPMQLVHMADTSTFRDVMMLKVDSKILQQAAMPPQVVSGYDPNNRAIQTTQLVGLDNPYSFLLKPLEFDDADLGEPVYISGMTTASMAKVDNGQIISVLADITDFTFEGYVVSVIEQMPINDFGVKRMYRIFGTGEPGFSGGLVLNKDGKVIGLTTAISSSGVQTGNFLMAISSKDIRDELKKIKH